MNELWSGPQSERERSPGGGEEHSKRWGQQTERGLEFAQVKSERKG